MKQMFEDYEDYEREPEILTEYFEDTYDQIPDYPQYDDAAEQFYGRVAGQSGLSPFSFAEIMEHCLEPTLKDGLAHVGKLIFWCLVFRLLTQSGALPKRISAHLISFLTGVFISTHFFYLNTAYMIGLTVVSYATLFSFHELVGAYRGVSLAVVCLSYNILCEVLSATPTDWHQVRGAQMILSMKIISVGFDVDSFEIVKVESEAKDKKSKISEEYQSHARRRKNRSKAEPHQKVVAPETAPELDLSEGVPLINFLGYAFCPGNCVFGPWVKYSEYIEIFCTPRWNMAWLMKVLFSLIFGFLFLTISTCWNPWLIPDENHRWVLAYRDAMSFRASHYFVSFVSDSASVACGFGFNRESGHWIFQVAEPHQIEVPRSLVEVVVSWNRPLHKWLKTYCFKKSLPFGSFFAILTTYLASTMLHGLNFQLGAVLFSLGFYTYTEHSLRKKLSSVLNAAVGSRREPSVNHVHKEGDLLSIFINLIFGILAMFHLAYLGVMFDQQETQTEGYSWMHTIKKWESLGFASHWVITAEFIIMCLI